MTAGRCLAVLITTALLVMSADAQQRAPSRQTATFTAPDGAFRFSYPRDPRDSQVCTKDKIQPCMLGYLPVCLRDALVCVIYAPGEFNDTSFSVASFQVSEVSRAADDMTADLCVTPDPQKEAFLISAERPVEMIDGLQFVHGWDAGAAMGHWSRIDLYRAFHNGKCFELSLTETGVNPNMSDPPMKTLTPAQQKELDETMSDVLHSFRFTK